jgi:hypothetical protein
MGNTILSSFHPKQSCKNESLSKHVSPNDSGVQQSNIKHEDDATETLPFASYDEYDKWFKLISRQYALLPKTHRSDLMKHSSVNAATFPYDRIIYKCKTHKGYPSPCGFKLVHKYNFNQKIIYVEFNPGKESLLHRLFFRYKLYLTIFFAPGLHKKVTENDINNQVTMIRTQDQMTQDELQMLKQLSLTHAPRASLQLVMKGYTAGKRKFDPDLISRIAYKGRKDTYGNDEKSLRKLTDFGNLILSHGGPFRLEYDNMNLIGAFLQHSIEVLLSREYGSRIVYLDGTHHTTR